MSSIVLFGPPGSGKTTLASSLYKLNYRPIFYDIDKKIPGMYNLQPLIEEGLIEVITPDARLSETSLRQKVLTRSQKPLTQPKGYLELVDFVTELEENPPEDAYKCVPVIDSFTKVNEHLTRLILHTSGKDKFEFSEWASQLGNLEEFFDSFFSLTPRIYPHCIITFHTMIEKDEVTGKIKTLPLVGGQFRGKVGSYVSEMYYCYTEADRQGNVQFMVQTKPVKDVEQARTSRDLNTYVDSDFEIIFKGELAPVELNIKKEV
jgi:hypothetical protein